MATIPLFISVPSGLEEDAAEELTRQLRPPTPLKTLQGQVLVNVDLTALGGGAATVARLLSLTTVDYVHVLLASTALFSSGTSEDGERVAPDPLEAIRSATAAVPAARFDAALELWRAANPEMASLPRDALAFRCLGKRGGRGHTFTSDDAKRAAGRGLGAATGLPGSTRDYHFDVLAQVHCNRCWVGLRLNRSALTKHVASPAATTAAAPDVPATGDAPALTAAAVAPHAAAQQREPATAAARAPWATSPLLASWGRARLRELGLDRPRDVRDAAAPLHEMELGEQRRRKHSEMATIVARIAAATAAGGSGGGGGGGGGDGLSRRGRKRLEQEASAAAACGDADADADGEEEGGDEAATATDGDASARKDTRGAATEAMAAPTTVMCAPMRHAPAGRPYRNKCDLSFGRDRQGRACCGFRLGEGQGADHEAVAPPEALPFVPPWMVEAAAAATVFMRGESSAGGGVLLAPWKTLTLRWSEARREGVAMLTSSTQVRTDAHDDGEAEGEVAESSEAAATVAGGVEAGVGQTATQRWRRRSRCSWQRARRAAACG